MRAFNYFMFTATRSSNNFGETIELGLQSQVLNILNESDKTREDLLEALGHYPNTVDNVLKTLIDHKKIFLVDSKYLLCPEVVAQKSLASGPTDDVQLKTITIPISKGLLQDLKGYAADQETSIEMEAAHLLGEIVRLYKATNVIPF